MQTLFTTESHQSVVILTNNSFLKTMKTFKSPQLLIIDELGYLPVDKQGAELLFGHL